MRRVCLEGLATLSLIVYLYLVVDEEEQCLKILGNFIILKFALVASLSVMNMIGDWKDDHGPDRATDFTQNQDLSERPKDSRGGRSGMRLMIDSQLIAFVTEAD